MVIVTCEEGCGRGCDQERAEALFAESHEVLNRIVGTKGDKVIVLCRTFEQEDCISAGHQLPPLAEATPDAADLRMLIRCDEAAWHRQQPGGPHKVRLHPGSSFCRPPSWLLLGGGVDHRTMPEQ